MPYQHYRGTKRKQIPHIPLQSNINNTGQNNNMHLIQRSNSINSTFSEKTRQINYPVNNHPPNDFEGYNEPRRQARMPKKLGTGEVPNDSEAKGFAGGDRRVWIYIYRVMKSASETIENYTKAKPDF